METKKLTNPKDALSIKKAPLHLIPTGPLYEVGLAMLEGGRKYGAHNYRAVGTRASVYYDAAKRHIDAWWEGEDIDPDSGIHHLMKAAACLFVQRDSQIMGNDVDDRPIKYPHGLPLDKFNKQAAEIVEKYQKCVEPFTEKGKTSDGTSPGYGDNEPEEFEGFIIKKSCNDREWLIRLKNAGLNKPQHLYRDLKLRGWVGSGSHDQSYYKTKDEARDTIRAYKNKVVYKVKELEPHGWYVDRLMNGYCTYLYPDLKWYSIAIGGHPDDKTGAWHPTKEIAEAYLKAYREKNKSA